MKHIHSLFPEFHPVHLLLSVFLSVTSPFSSRAGSHHLSQSSFLSITCFHEHHPLLPSSQPPYQSVQLFPHGMRVNNAAADVLLPIRPLPAFQWLHNPVLPCPRLSRVSHLLQPSHWPHFTLQVPLASHHSWYPFSFQFLLNPTHPLNVRFRFHFEFLWLLQYKFYLGTNAGA